MQTRELDGPKLVDLRLETLDVRHVLLELLRSLLDLQPVRGGVVEMLDHVLVLLLGLLTSQLLLTHLLGRLQHEHLELRPPLHRGLELVLDAPGSRN